MAKSMFGYGIPFRWCAKMDMSAYSVFALQIRPGAITSCSPNSTSRLCSIPRSQPKKSSKHLQQDITVLCVQVFLIKLIHITSTILKLELGLPLRKSRRSIKLATDMVYTTWFLKAIILLHKKGQDAINTTNRILNRFARFQILPRHSVTQNRQRLSHAKLCLKQRELLQIMGST